MINIETVDLVQAKVIACTRLIGRLNADLVGPNSIKLANNRSEEQAVEIR